FPSWTGKIKHSFLPLAAYLSASREESMRHSFRFTAFPILLGQNQHSFLPQTTFLSTSREQSELYSY
ncbi:hypothetical protein, partial [Neobacillus kokaensis]|uniref:hypothetical protein n=1 Tax=Neobacillus kokaensis TaxID=2759023 RepID=UPI001CB8F33B